MTRDKALEELVARLEGARARGDPFTRFRRGELQEIIAALSSCACEGREPIAVLSAWVNSKCLERGLTVYDALYEDKGPWADAFVRVLVFALPAEEKA